MKKTTTFILSGGLGNQLFQFSALHYFAARNNAKYKVYFPTPLDSARDFDLAQLCTNCDHISEVIRTRNHVIDFKTKLNGFIKHRSVFLYNFFKDKLVYEESSPYVFQEGSSNAHLILGYFQHWKYVWETQQVLNDEIAPLLDSIFESLQADFIHKPFGIVHFRQGDLLSFSQNMGLLDKSYFEDAIANVIPNSKSGISLVVLSDDVARAKGVFDAHTEYIYGPEQFTAWQSLALMSRADFLITSNSTFSWWGSLFSHFSGGKIYIPEPWFRNWTPDPGEAFCYPGFNVLSANFKK